MSRERCVEGALLALATLGSGARALGLGQDINPDQLIYHVYLGWSLLAGRLDADVAPVGLGSYLNPLVYTLSYLGLTRLPPRLFGFLLGAADGVNVFLVYRLARVVLRGVPHERSLSVLAAVVAATGACAVSLLGTTFADNLVSILVLAAFLLIARVADDAGRASARPLAVAGALGSAAIGLKLTFAIYFVGLAVAAALLAARRRSPRVALAFAAGGAVGYALTGGYWAVEMWRRFGNPVFPFFNDVFRSPFFALWAPRDLRWVMRSWTELLSTPLEMAVGSARGGLQEIAFRDPRCAAVLAVVVGAAAVAIWRRRVELAPASAWVVIVGWLAAYVAWMRVFHYYRYFAAGEFLAPVAVLGLLRLLDAKRLPAVWLAVAVIVVATTRTQLWGRMAWRDEPLQVSVPLPRTDPPAAVMVDGDAFSFVLPFFPPGTRFFGALWVSEAFERLVARELERHRGPVYRLRTEGGTPTPLLRFGLADAGPCVTFRTGGRGRLSLCPLVRV